MNPSTKISKPSGAGRATALLLLLLLALALPVRAADFSAVLESEDGDTVTVSVTADIGRASAGSVRKSAIEAALAEVVASAAERLAPDGDVDGGKAIRANALSYVSRYAVDEETLEQGQYRMKLTAKVNREALFGALDALGARGGTGPRVLPRVLVAAGPEGNSGALAKTMAEMLKGSGFGAARADERMEAVGIAAERARGRGYPLALLVNLDMTPQEVPPGSQWAVNLKSTCSGALVDTRRGDLLRYEERLIVTEAQEVSAAEEDGAKRCAEELFRAMRSALLKYETTAVTDAGPVLELRLTALESPGVVTEFADLLAGSSDFRNTVLDRLETRSAVWKAQAASMDVDPLDALDRLKIRTGRIQWKALAPVSKTGEQAYEGRWSPR